MCPTWDICGRPHEATGEERKINWLLRRHIRGPWCPRRQARVVEALRAVTKAAEGEHATDGDLRGLWQSDSREATNVSQLCWRPEGNGTGLS